MPLILDLGLILFVYNGSFIGNYLVSKRFLQRAEPGIPLSQRMNNVLPVLTYSILDLHKEHFHQKL